MLPGAGGHKRGKEGKFMTQKDKPSSDTLKRYFKRDLFANHVGIELIDAHDGYAKASLSIKEHHLNGVRRVHGGAIFTLADLAFAAASNSRGRVAVAINASVQFLRAPQGSVIYAEAREISCDHKLASYEITVTDGAGDVISLFQGMVYRKKESTDYFEKG
jgi:acyl-CoA thioesterase